MTLSKTLACWTGATNFDALPEDVVTTTKLRVLDVIGLALAGAETEFGRSVRTAALTMASPGPCRIIGTRERAALIVAAFANGAFPQALEFDDTHVESIVHMSSPAVAAGMALAGTGRLPDAISSPLLPSVTKSPAAWEASLRANCIAADFIPRVCSHPSVLLTLPENSYSSIRTGWCTQPESAAALRPG
jgi:MmgE/PrpD N-terminal domain